VSSPLNCAVVNSEGKLRRADAILILDISVFPFSGLVDTRVSASVFSIT
jgi:hypothetical protein